MTIPSAPRLCRGPAAAVQKVAQQGQRRPHRRGGGDGTGDHVLDLQIPTHFHGFGSHGAMKIARYKGRAGGHRCLGRALEGQSEWRYGN